MAQSLLLRFRPYALTLLITIAGLTGLPDLARAAAADVVLYASEASVVKGNWTATDRSGAAGSASMASADRDWSSTDAPLASPAHYFEMTFDAAANTPYRVWLRLRAAGDSKWNDAVWVQFSDAVSAGGSAAYRVGTTSALMVNLARCSTCGTADWGWQNTAYWLNQETRVMFSASGSHTIRVQTREDGVEVDQIVLSPATFLSSAPGPLANDTTIVSKASSMPGTGTGSMAYESQPVAVPGTIEAARFDDGGPGVAYSDETSGNTGGAFRATDVDLQAASGGGYNVGWISAGEWLKYTVDVASADTYAVDLRVASPSGASVEVDANGTAGTVSVPATGGWQAWTTVSLPLSLAAGPQTLTVRFPTSGVNLRSVTVQSGTASPPAEPDPADPPATEDPQNGGSHTVQAGDDLQSVIDAAQPGDTILLEPGATFVGNFVLPARSDSSADVITIRSAAPDSALPGSDTRMTPEYSAQLPRLRSPNTAPALATAAGAHHYRLMFLELLANEDGAGTILALGDGSAQQNTLSSVPHDLVVDRVYIHGDDGFGQKRGIALNSASTDVLNSYISDIKTTNNESQAIAGWNGPGPFTIANNYLEGAAQNLMFGGADPKIPNLVPSDITITGNLFSKPLAWRSKDWQIKNLLELKNAQRVVIDGNVFEHSWAAAQQGYAVVLKSVNQGGTAPWSVVRDVTFTNNVVRRVSSAINILGRDTTHPSVEASGITIRNNLFHDVSGETYGGTGRFMVINGGSDITVDHNTLFTDGTVTLVPDNNPVDGFVFTNNVMLDNGAAIKGAGIQEGTTTLDEFFPGAQVFGNLLVGSSPSLYPTANFYPETLEEVGFVDLLGGDLRLSLDSIFGGGGTDGEDPGCDIDALNAATGESY